MATHQGCPPPPPRLPTRSPTAHPLNPGAPDCWPTHATICAMLMGEPLEPHWLMMSGELW